MAAAAALVWAWAASKQDAIASDLRDLSAWLEQRGRVLAALAGALTAVVAVSFGTYSPSGADASGYLSQADMWSHLAMALGDPLVVLPGWPLAPGETAPLGWRPALQHGWQVPTYAPGLPLLMAVPHALAGITGAVLVVAISAGFAVAATGALACRLGGGMAAVMASMMLASSPTFLYQAFQPMSDVPVTAAWAICWWLVSAGSPTGAGVAAAAAAMIRPNLAPLAVLPWMVVARRAAGPHRSRHAWQFALPVAVAGGAIALVQWRWYGSALISGYGSAAELFALVNLAPNARLYASWLWHAERVFVLVTACALCGWGLARMWPDRGNTFEDGSNCSQSRDGRAKPHLGLVAFASGVTAAYLVYAVFETWSYLRFLLPAMAVVLAIVGATLAAALRRLPTAGQGLVALALVVAASAGGLKMARDLGVFQVAAVAARAWEMGERLRATLPPHAVLLSGEQSGSMRYATNRPIVRWEALDAAALIETLRVLRANGYEPWWVLDQFEEARVRARFPDVPAAALDGPPDVESGPLMRTRAWRIRSTTAGRERP